MTRQTVMKWTFCLVTLSFIAQSESVCRVPAPASNYTNDQYEGLWYDVGKIQTQGGAYYQRFCVCDTATFTPDDPLYAGGIMDYNCRNATIDGPETPIQGILTPGEVPGNFKQRFSPLQPPADYNVIWIDEDTAMEYDCASSFGIINYCVHFMSRTPSIAPEKLQIMIAFAENLDLNPNELEYKPTPHEGCWVK